MPFSPLPKTFLEDLHRYRRGRVVELGCGDGRFTALMAGAGVRPLCIDRRPPYVGTVADLVADATALPLADGSVDVLVAGNLLRHIWPLSHDSPVPSGWQCCLATEGRLYVFEDEPADTPLAVRHYRDLLIFLTRFSGVGRRPLLPRRTFEAALATGPQRSGCWRLGWQDNHWPVDIAAIQGLLRGNGRKLTGEAQRLASAIDRDGLSYGIYWWACWIPEAVA